MKNNFRTALAVASSTLLLVSCKKDTSSDNAIVNSLTGTWKLVSTRADAELIMDGDTYRTITTSDYAGEKIKGTYTFKDSTVTAKDISYEIHSSATSIQYYNGDFLDSATLPFNYVIPTTSTTSTFHILGSDSLSMSTSTNFQNSMPGTSGIPPTSNVHYLIKGDSLFLDGVVKFTSESQVDGYTQHMQNSAALSSVMVKQ